MRWKERLYLHEVQLWELLQVSSSSRICLEVLGSDTSEASMGGAVAHLHTAVQVAIPDMENVLVHLDRSLLPHHQLHVPRALLPLRFRSLLVPLLRFRYLQMADVVTHTVLRQAE
jgi:hypothetical protein